MEEADRVLLTQDDCETRAVEEEEVKGERDKEGNRVTLRVDRKEVPMGEKVEQEEGVAEGARADNEANAERLTEPQEVKEGEEEPELLGQGDVVEERHKVGNTETEGVEVEDTLPQRDDE